MKKGILIVAILTAWFFAKNSGYVQLVTTKEIKLDKKAILFAQELKKDLIQFTTVHLYTAKKTNNSKHNTQPCLLQVTNDKHLYNHEPLLIVNGL